MRVLIVNCVYRNGSTGKIVYDTQKYLTDNGHEVLVCYGNFLVESELPSYKFCKDIEVRINSIFTKIGKKQFSDYTFSTRRLIKRIEMFGPDVVHLHCLNGYCLDVYHLLQYLANHQYKTVVTHHAEFFYTGSCSHAFDCDKWYKEECKKCQRLLSSTNNRIFADAHSPWLAMKSAFDLFSKENLKFTAVSPWVRERSLMSPIVNWFDCKTIYNGLETSVFSYRGKVEHILNRMPNKDNKIVFFATASFRPNHIYDIKGGKHLLKLASLLPDITFVVAALDYDASITLPENIYFWGAAQNQNELAELYSTSDATIILSERETFSMITAESLSCGTPVVGFCAGGPESIAIKEYSHFVKERDVEKLATALREMLLLEFNREQISTESHRIYSKECMASAYFEVYESFFK